MSSPGGPAGPGGDAGTGPGRGLATNELAHARAARIRAGLEEARETFALIAADEAKAKRKRPVLRVVFTYFIAADNGLIKIGSSESPLARVRQLQTGSPCRLRLITAVPAGLASESELHDRFAAHRSHGEWFHPHLDLVAFIADAGRKYGVSGS